MRGLGTILLAGLGTILLAGLGTILLAGLAASLACSTPRESGRTATHVATVRREATTRFLPTPIAADGHGHYVMRRARSATFFTSSGLAFSLSDSVRRWALHVDWVGAREGALAARDEQRARVNSYTAGAASEVPAYGGIAWEQLVPGVDASAEPVAGGVTYSYRVAPGAKITDVVMRWSGATSMRVVDGGRGVDVGTAIGTLTIRGLRAFAVEGGQRVELPARHVVRGNDVSLEVDGWSGTTPLIIDPTIAWSSFLGGASNELGYGVAVDGAGNVIVAGSTQSADFPTTTGALDPTLGGGEDAFVTKVSGAGALMWSSFLGGTASDNAYSVAVDPSGNVVVAGSTSSTNFPSSGGLQTTTAGGGDAFVTKLTSAGALVWSTYVGGSASDYALAVESDSGGNVLIAGATNSTNFPSSGGLKTSLGGTEDGFLTKISGAGALVWSTYLGGGANDHVTALAVDAVGNTLLTGPTRSTDFPSFGGFRTTLAGGEDAYVTKISGTGALVWSSYLGGALQDSGSGIAVDAAGNAIVAGFTKSADFPTTAGLKVTRSGTQDAFVAKVTDLGTLAWSSYLGGSGSDSANAVAVDSSGAAYLVGSTDSADFPSTGAFKPHGGSQDAFVAKIGATGGLGWGVFLGGSAFDLGYGVAVDATANVYAVGYTQSKDFPVAGGFNATTSLDPSEAFVAKLAPPTLAAGTACTSSGACVSGLCVDGVCCDSACAGRCEACSAAKKGAGINGVCGPIVDGSDPDRECASSSCSAGIVTKPQVCNGARACRSDGTLSCGMYPCAGAACRTSCASDTECVASAFCSMSTCIADRSIGGACTLSSQCASGFCVDGVCCDKPCSGACDACSAVAKGSGADGACGPVAADTDPRDRCAVLTGVCAADGLCDGAGNCRSFAKAGTSCGATTCTAGVVTGKVCKGDSATCLDAASAACAPFACGASACKTICASDADCDAAAYCTASAACVPKRARGAACAENRECASELCADSVCCNSACNGACESCSEPGTIGTCTAVAGTPRGTRAACDTLAANDCARTTCDGVIRDKCAGYANGTTTPCGANVCTEDRKFVAAGTCDRGKCSTPAPLPCTPYVCDVASPTGCRSSCSADGDCSAGFRCADGVCVQGPTCNADKSASLDKAGNATLCAPYRCGTDGRCLQACTTTADCAAANLCDVAAKLCLPPTEAPDESGGCGCVTAPRRGPLSATALIAFAALVTMRRRRAVVDRNRGRS